jgi:hypothetical protein
MSSSTRACTQRSSRGSEVARYFTSTNDVRSGNAAIVTPTAAAVSAWVIPFSNAGGDKWVTGLTNSGGGGYEWVIWIRNGGEPSFYASDGGAKYATSSEAVALHRPYHLLGTVEGGSLRIYLNGVLRGSTGFGTVSGASDRYLQTGDNPSFLGFHGMIWDVAVWDKAFTARDARELFHGRSPGQMYPASLKAWVPLEDRGVAQARGAWANTITQSSPVLHVPTPQNRSIMSPDRDSATGKPRLFDVPPLSHKPGFVARGAPLVYVARPSTVHFTSLTQWYSIPEHTSFNLGTDTTFASWIYLDGTTTALQCMFTDLRESPVEYTSDFRVTYTAGSWYLATTGNNIDATTATSTKPLPIHRWIHVAMATDGTNAYFYRHGALEETIAMNRTDVQVSEPWVIGRCWGTSGGIGEREFGGAMQHMGVFNRRLSRNEIIAHMRGARIPGSAIDMDFSNVRPVDLSKNRHVVTPNGSPRRMIGQESVPSSVHGYSEVSFAGFMLVLPDG